MSKQSAQVELARLKKLMSLLEKEKKKHTHPDVVGSERSKWALKHIRDDIRSYKARIKVLEEECQE